MRWSLATVWRCSIGRPCARRRGNAAAARLESGTTAGHAQICTSVAALVDTNVLVYRYDHRFPDKQAIATATLRTGIEDDSLRLSHQTILEFVAATTRGPRNAPALLEMDDARREAEELLREFPMLYPNDEVVRTALRGTATYQLSWFDAHMWAYAEVYGLDTLLSEDFEHGRYYGTVKVVNPFIRAG